MKISFTILLFIILSSCAQKTDEGSIYILKSLQNNVIDSYVSGTERFEMMKELASDKTHGKDFRSRIFDLYGFFRKADSLTGILVRSIDSIKLKMLTDIDCKSAIFNYENNMREYNPIMRIDLSKVDYTGETDVLKGDNAQLIIGGFKRYRKELCEIIEISQFTDGSMPSFFFKDPEINTFKDLKDFNLQFDKGLKRSNVSQDDIESLRTIYSLLTIRDTEWKSMLSEKEKWSEALTVLLTLQNQIFKARNQAFRIMSSRFCVADYGFTHIVPVVNGPDIAYEGDTVILEIFYGAINVEKQPEIDLESQGKIMFVKDGRSYVKIIVPKGKTYEASGTITVRNKSGVPKTEQWFKHIKVLPINKHLKIEN